MKLLKTAWRWLARLLVLLAALTLMLVLYLWLFVDEKRPSGQAGPDADQLARRIQRAVGIAAWRDIGAVRWNFGGRHRLLWDRRRGLVRVRWKKNEVLLRLSDKQGLASRNGKPCWGQLQGRLLEHAYRHFINDSFWLNPFDKLFDKGVTRQIVVDETGKEQLLIRFASGGVTPGDAYLIATDKNARPIAWKMWVEIIPVGGLEASWQGYQQVFGAWLATRHEIWLMTLRLTDIKAAKRLAELESPDPFAKLATVPQATVPKAMPTSQPASRPTK
jgi:hypothetical protein